jgi:hypothetical protein
MTKTDKKTSPPIEWVWDLVNHPQEGGTPLVGVDSNVLIALCDKTHQYHTGTREFFEKWHARRNGRAYYFIMSRLEVLEYFRRRAITLYLREFYAKGKDFGMPRFDEMCRGLGPICCHMDDWVSLDDRQIKKVRSQFYDEMAAQSGTMEKARTYWKQLCGLTLNKRIHDVFAALEPLGIEYASLHTAGLFPKGTKGPSWDQQERIMIEHGMASADASILNMVNSSQALAGIITNDIDMFEFFRAGGAREGLRCFTFIKGKVG